MYAMKPTEESMSDADGFLLDRQHPGSLRYAILEASARCAWLYLTVPENYRVERDAFVFSPGPLVTRDEAVGSASLGEAPPLSVDYATPEAVLPDARREHFAFRWSDDGQSVAVLYQGNPIAMIVAGAERGYSRALSRSGPFGFPWDSEVYDATFGP
jgi:hypothetical protein